VKGEELLSDKADFAFDEYGDIIIQKVVWSNESGDPGLARSENCTTSSAGHVNEVLWQILGRAAKT